MEREDIKEYESTVIVRDAAGISAVYGAAEKYSGAVVRKSEPVKLKLAYPISDQTYGFLVSFAIRIDSEHVNALIKEWNGMDGVLRAMVRRSGRIVREGKDAGISEISSSSALDAEIDEFRANPKKKYTPFPPIITNEVLKKKIKELES